MLSVRLNRWASFETTAEMVMSPLEITPRSFRILSTASVPKLTLPLRHCDSATTMIHVASAACIFQWRY